MHKFSHLSIFDVYWIKKMFAKKLSFFQKAISFNLQIRINFARSDTNSIATPNVIIANILMDEIRAWKKLINVRASEYEK